MFLKLAYFQTLREKNQIRFISTGQLALSLLPFCCVCSSAVNWHLPAARQIGHWQLPPKRQTHVSGGDSVSSWALTPKEWHGTQILGAVTTTAAMGDAGQKSYQIFIRLRRVMQILWSRERRSVWVGVGAATDGNNGNVGVRFLFLLLGL